MGEFVRFDQYLKRLMSDRRLTVGEVAAAARLSRRSIIRLRHWSGETHRPRPETLRRLADALGELAHVDADETFGDLMMAAGHESQIRQGDLGMRGLAEIVSHYQRMSGLGRHLLLEQARLFARQLPEK